MTKEEIKILVSSPKLPNLMPKNFNSDEEAEHLSFLVENCEGLRSYCFEEFICSGGSGMVFKAKRTANDDFSTAIKIVRKKVYEKVVYGNMPSGIGHRDDCFCGRGYDIERGEDWRN